MPFIPIPNSATLCFNWVTAGQNWQFCLTVRKSAGAITPADLETITTTANGWWDATLKPLMGNENLLANITATDQQTQGGPQDIEVVGEPGTGGGSTAVPMNAAQVISLRTQKRGRSYRGRNYTGGWPAVTLASQVDWSGSASLSRASAWNSLANVLDLVGFDVVVASKQHNNTVTNPAETNEIIAYLADVHIDSMRKRLFGRGT